MDKNLRELTRFSKFRKDETIFTQDIVNHLLGKAVKLEREGCLAYAGAIGEDKMPILFTADDHVIKRSAQRFGMCYASVILAQIMESIEKCDEIGNLLFEIEDEVYSRGETDGIVALWIEESDIFCYVVVKDGCIHVATVVTDCPVYYVNEKIDAICWIRPNNKLVRGIQNIYKFAPSEGNKFKKFK